MRNAYSGRRRDAYVPDMDSTSESDREMLPEPFPETPADVEAADWPADRSAEVPYTFDDDGFVVSFDCTGEQYEPLPGSWYYVPPEAGDKSDAEDVETWQAWWRVYRHDPYGTRERTAVLLGRLSENTGFWWVPQGPPNCVPVCVAADGQKAIAAYQYARRRYHIDLIAERMGKAESTIRQYLSDYKAGRSG